MSAGRPLARTSRDAALLTVVAAVFIGCGSAADGPSRACNEALTVLKRDDLGPGELAAELERISDRADAETRRIFRPTVKELRVLAREGMSPDEEEIYPVLDGFLVACGLPVE